MNLSEYTFLLNNPNAFNEKQARELEKVVENFPYFQSARALYLKGLYNQDSYKYNFALKKTAAYTTDRTVLFDFITSSDFVVLEKDHYEQKLAQLMEMEVVESVHVESDKEISTITVKPTVEFESAEIEFVKISTDKVISSPIINDFEETSSKDEQNKASSNKLNQEVIDYTESKIASNILTVSTEAESIEEPTTAIVKEEEVLAISSNSTKTDNSLELEEKLEIGKPITFAVNEKHSFQEWLQLTSIKPIIRNEEPKKVEFISEKVEKTTPEKLKKLAIIDKFIETNPKITPAKELIETPSKPIELSDTTHLMTETLARVYLEQKKYSKAIQAYEILILKYPEKSIFFADRIKDIKILQQNNQ